MKSTLTPTEQALLSLLQRSSDAHEQRLSDLESRLIELSERSKGDSDSAVTVLHDLQDSLGRLWTQLDELAQWQRKLEPALDALSKRSSTQETVYKQMITAFNLMKLEYQRLASELQALRALAQ